MTRYGTPHQPWSPSEAFGQILKSLPGNGWYCLNAELLHSKTPDIHDTNFIFDLLVYKSQKLIDLTFAQRQALLFASFVDQIVGEERDYFILNSRTWMLLRTSPIRRLSDSIVTDRSEMIRCATSLVF